jgi:hypothetical protein
MFDDCWMRGNVWKRVVGVLTVSKCESRLVLCGDVRATVSLADVSGTAADGAPRIRPLLISSDEPQLPCAIRAVAEARREPGRPRLTPPGVGTDNARPPGLGEVAQLVRARHS